MRPTTPQETAAILAGLRLLELEAEAPQHLPGLIYDLATQDGKLRMLRPAEIDRLCERIGVMAVWLGEPYRRPGRQFGRPARAGGESYGKR